LLTIPGIGKVLAPRIVDQNPLSEAELRQVEGIDQQRAEQLWPMIAEMR
jgi:DNA uptake protein ComE-like DNA-binding protein